MTACGIDTGKWFVSTTLGTPEVPYAVRFTPTVVMCADADGAAAASDERPPLDGPPPLNGPPPRDEPPLDDGPPRPLARVDDALGGIQVDDGTNRVYRRISERARAPCMGNI